MEEDEMTESCPNCGSVDWYNLGSGIHQCLVCGNLIGEDGEEY